jgi:hypothetical protein
VTTNIWETFFLCPLVGWINSSYPHEPSPIHYVVSISVGNWITKAVWNSSEMIQAAVLLPGPAKTSTLMPSGLAANF